MPPTCTTPDEAEPKACACERPLGHGSSREAVSVDAENPRDYAEQIKLGGEYTFYNTLSLRAGYIFPTAEQGISLGAGVQQEFAGFGFGADYAYTNFGVFSGVQRIALRLSF